VDVRTAVPLAELTTLRLGGPARRVLEPAGTDELVETVRHLDRAGEPVLIVGGGSNLVVADAGFPGTVVRLATRGVSERRQGDDTVAVTVAAGEPWDDLVERSVAEGLAGVEALSGIPGLAGATPVQNVGAYGQEVGDTLLGVTVLDRAEGSVRTMTPAQCRLGYRTSLLKGSDRYLVVDVTLGLHRRRVSGPLAYAELATSLGADLGGTAPTADVRATVLALRRSKGMVLDPADLDTASAGSFFTNPVLPAPGPDRLPADAPRYDAGPGLVKVPAAWLVEHAGFARGYGHGAARISGKHTLALTNRGGATTVELLALAGEVRAGVRRAFGVELRPEPLLVGCSIPEPG